MWVVQYPGMIWGGTSCTDGSPWSLVLVINCPTPSLRGVPKGQEWQLLEVKFIPEGGRRERDQGQYWQHGLSGASSLVILIFATVERTCISTTFPKQNIPSKHWYSASSVVHHGTLVTTVTDRKSIFAVCAGFSLSGPHTYCYDPLVLYPSDMWYYIHQMCGYTAARFLIGIAEVHTVSFHFRFDNT